MSSKILTSLLFLTLSLVLSAVEIEFSLSKHLEATPEDVERFKVILQKRNMGMSDKNAKIAIQENRLLANAYMKAYGIPEVLQKEMQILLEEQLRNMLIKKEKETIEINDDVLRSYYKDNKHEFYKPDAITFNIYSFQNYDDAHAFYANNKDRYAHIKQYVKEHNVSVDSKTLPLRTLHKELQALLKDVNSTQYITPPEYFYKKYIVLDVVAIEKAALMPFSEAKKRAKTLLLNKINRDTKEQLLKKYEKSGKE